MNLSCEFTNNPIPPNFNFSYDVVDRYAAECPDKLALVWCNDANEELRLTFSQVSRRSQQTANFLHEHGLKKGDVVMLMLRRQIEYWDFVLACHRIGIIANPCAEQLTADDIKYRANASGAKMIILSDSETLAMEVEKAGLKNVEKVEVGKIQLDNYSDTFPRPPAPICTTIADPMLIFFTSGTSSFPKMVVHNYAYPLAHINTAKNWQQVQENKLHFSWAETGWAKASWGKIYGQWICGAPVFVYDRKGFNPQNVLSKIKKYNIATFCAPPTIYRYLVMQKNLKEMFTSVEHACTAGEALPSDIAQKMKDITGLSLYEGYGQTETTVLVGNFRGMEVRSGSMGKASPFYKIDIINNKGNPCTSGEIGEIVVDLRDGHPLGLFSGYYKDEQKTAEVFAGGFYHTKDLAYRDDEGYFFFAGRKDDIIKSAGFRISPYEVEEILCQHACVAECAVTGVEDSKRGQIIKATVVLKKGFLPSKELQNELMVFTKTHTAMYKAPRIIEFVNELPKTFNGKIKRSDIRKKKESK